MRIRWEFSNASLVVKLHTFKLFKHILNIRSNKNQIGCFKFLQPSCEHLFV